MKPIHAGSARQNDHAPSLHMSSGEVKRRRFFEHGRKCLDAICTPPPGGYVCPICLTLFTDSNELCLEHAPPESLGGKELCLTCGPCNHRAGHTIDAALYSSSKFAQFLQHGTGAQRAKLRVDGTHLNVDASRDSRGVKIILPAKFNNPGNLESGKPAMLRAMGEEGEFTLTISRKFRMRDADIGYLKSAYLLAFAKYGYWLVLQPAFDIVRKQICEPHVNHIPRFRISLKEMLPQERGLYISREPLIALLVIDRTSVIVLPWGAPTDESVYAWLARNEATRSSLRFKMSRASPWPRTLEQTLDCLALSKSSHP